jgi:signal-transduction protein with cAMP-binding, CBS, and nucleotidyltransferase domain
MDEGCREREARRRAMTIKQLLERKSKCLWTIAPDASVLDAISKMADKDVGSLLVMDDEQLVGIITERQYARNVMLKGKASVNTPVKDIMERNVIHVTQEHSVELCMALMTEKRIRHLPVLKGSKVVGIVSIGDLLNFVISKKQIDIDHLEHYIQGDGWQSCPQVTLPNKQ